MSEGPQLSPTLPLIAVTLNPVLCLAGSITTFAALSCRRVPICPCVGMQRTKAGSLRLLGLLQFWLWGVGKGHGQAGHQGRGLLSR